MSIRIRITSPYTPRATGPVDHYRLILRAHGLGHHTSTGGSHAPRVPCAAPRTARKSRSAHVARVARAAARVAAGDGDGPPAPAPRLVELRDELPPDPYLADGDALVITSWGVLA